MGTCLIIKSGGGTDTSNATATADKILSGYTIYSNDNKITGTMTNVGTQTASGLNAGGSTTVKAGWHNGSGTVTTNSLSSQTGGTSIAVGDVLTGYTYWSSGAKATGTMTSRGTKTWTIGVNGSQTIESGWHSGSGTIKQSSTVATSSEWKLMTPTTSNQTLCNASTYYSQNRWCAGSDKLIAANIKKDITIFGIKGTWAETKRWLIQNGAVTGLVSSDLLVCRDLYNNVSNIATKTYNGSTYTLLVGNGVDYDDGAWWGLIVYRRFKNITSIASFGKTSWGCRIHADILTNFTGSSSSGAKASIVGNFVYVGGTWRGSPYLCYSYASGVLDKSGWLGLSNGSVGCGNVTVNATKISNLAYWGEASVDAIGSYVNGKLAENDLVFRGTMTNCSTNSGSWYYIWCRNLWLETAETTP